MVFAPSWSENGYRLGPIWSGIGFRGNYCGLWTYLSIDFKWIRNKPIICDFEMNFKKSFCWRSNLSNDIISVFVNMYVTFCDILQVWKRVWTLEARAENGFGKWHFWVWDRVRIWEPGGKSPTRIFGSTPPPPPGEKRAGRSGRVKCKTLKFSPYGVYVLKKY